jgi:LPS-assembly protein
MRLRSSEKTDLQWHFDYDTRKGRVNSSTLFASYYAGAYQFAVSHAFLQTPGEVFSPTSPIVGPLKFNQVRFLAGYGESSTLGFGSTASIGFDANRGFLQYGSLQTRYNWDCCGVTVEYRRFALGPVRNENQFRFGFTLANIGTFGNIRRRERIY